MNDAQPLTVTARFGDRTETCVLPLSSASCWSSLLGPWPLPVAGAIDQIGMFLADRRPDEITLSACPSACLLPLLWLRTIWFQTDTPQTIIDWARVENPSTDHARQPAGKLACMLADSIECSDPDTAWRLWGFNAQQRPNPEESFDLLTNIIDLWDTELGRVTQASEWNETMRRAMVECAAMGCRRVAIYGGGTHTRGVGDALLEPGVEIVCIIDDDARRHSEKMWGYKIVSRETAIGLDLDAVILSANTMEDKLWERTAVLREHGITVVPLYNSFAEHANTDQATLTETRS